MDFLLIFIIPVLLITAINVSLRPRNKGRRAKQFFIILGPPFIILFGDEIIGQAYLHTMCVVNGGIEYRNLVKTDGYFDSSHSDRCGSICIEALTRYRYSYYETEIRNHGSTFASDFHRYYFVERDSGLCAGGHEIPNGRNIIPEDRCVAYIKLSEPNSRYEVSMMNSSDLVQWPFRFEKILSYVKDRNSGDIIASATSYRYWGGWIRNNSFGNNGASSCPSSFRESHGAIFDTIITSTSKEKAHL